MKPIRVLLDLDEVLADFAGSADTQRRNPPAMYEPGFFLNLQPVPGALQAVQKLYQRENVELEVVSKPVANSPISYTEKAQWVAKWFPFLTDKITLTQDKANILGDILIDDTPYDFDGLSILFRQGGGKEEWARVLGLLDDAICEVESGRIFDKEDDDFDPIEHLYAPEPEGWTEVGEEGDTGYNEWVNQGKELSI